MALEHILDSTFTQQDSSDVYYHVLMQLSFVSSCRLSPFYKWLSAED